MALDQRSKTDELIAEARRERERMRQAEVWANEVLARVARVTPATGPVLAPQAPVAGSSTPSPVRATAS